MDFKSASFCFLYLSKTIKMLKSYIYISNCHIYVLITVYLAKLQYIYIQLPKYMSRKFQYIYIQMLCSVFVLSFLRSRYENATPNLCCVFCALLGVLRN